MSVRKIRNSWWVDFRFEGVRYRKKSPENMRPGAQAYELLLRSRLARGQPLHGPASPAARTFRSFAEEWFRTSMEPNIKPSTRVSARYTLERVLAPAFGSRHLEEVDQRAIDEFKAARLRAGIKPQTVNSDLSLLRACFTTAYDWGLLPRVPKVTRLREHHTEKLPLTVDDARKLLAARGPAAWHVALLLGLYAGLRLGEILALQWSAVHLDDPVPYLRVSQNMSAGEVTSPKGNRPREIPLATELLHSLARCARPEGFVVCRRDGRPYSRSAAGESLRRRCRAAGVRPIGWHILRHTFASLLNRAGGDGTAIQALLGHAKFATTALYLHLAEGSLQGTVALLPAFTSLPLGQPAGNAVRAAA